MSFRGTALSMQRRTDSTGSVSRHGLTLVELVISVSLGTIVLAGLASAMLIATRATDGVSGPAADVHAARQVADQIAADANHAIAFSEQSGTALELVVPDRDDDGEPETIRYAWSGDDGSGLIRQCNNGAEVTLAQQVSSLAFVYKSRPTFAIEPETLSGQLFSYADLVGGTIGSYDVDEDRWCAQYFKPALPTNTLSWSVSHVSLGMTAQNTARVVFLEIRPADMRLQPADQILQQLAISSAVLPLSLLFNMYEFQDSVELDPTTGVCLVIRQETGSAGARVAYHQNGTEMPQNAHWMTSDDAGESWSTAVNHQDLVLDVYGTITTEGPPRWD